MGDSGEAKPEKGGRYGLPGIPSYFDRVSQETIYTDKIKAEEAYLEKCKDIKTGDHMERMGVLKGFEIIKYPSYVEVRKIYNEEEKGEKGAFQIGRGTKYAHTGNTPPPSSHTSVGKPSLDKKLWDAQTECNRTAPTYAYKYFSEKHMATTRGGPRDDKERDAKEAENRRKGLELMSRPPPPWPKDEVVEVKPPPPAPETRATMGTQTMK